MNIYPNDFLRAMSYTFGVLASVLNLVSLVRTALAMRKQNKFETLINKATILLVSVGDLCFGMYLLGISVADYLHRVSGRNRLNQKTLAPDCLITNHVI